MIKSVKETLGYVVHATDGEIGKLVDYYFDDKEWTIRYLVIETGDWLGGRIVLISPISISGSDWSAHHVHTTLNREQVKQAPDIDTKRPVSRQMEMDFHKYYGYPFYWGGDAVWGLGMTPGALAAAAVTAPVLEQEEDNIEQAKNLEESHLGSTNVVIGYTIRARDGDIGHFADFIFDGETFRIFYMVVDTSNWLSGRKVMVPPTWVQTVDWARQEVVVDLNRQTIKDSPEFDLKALNQNQTSQNQNQTR